MKTQNDNEPKTESENTESAAAALPPAPCSAWREVSMDEFYRVIGPLNVVPFFVNNKWPYTSVFVTPDRQARGKIVGYLPEGSALLSKKYYLPNP